MLIVYDENTKSILASVTTPSNKALQDLPAAHDEQYFIPR